MNKPEYDLEKIKFGINERTWEKAVGLYQSDKVRNFEDTGFIYCAKVQGAHLYDVVVSKRSYTDGDCTCYLGQNDTLCKHMIALAIYGLKRGKALTQNQISQQNEIKFCGRKSEFNKEELRLIKAEITGALRYIKSYDGSSRTWFAYQDSLIEGCNRLSAVVSKLPVSRQTAKLLVNLLLRLEKKLLHYVDDSDGTVSGFMLEVVQFLEDFVILDPACKIEFGKLKDMNTSFGWEEPLLELVS